MAGSGRTGHLPQFELHSDRGQIRSLVPDLPAWVTEGNSS